MQIIGSSAIDDGINAIAQRANRTVVSNWVLRVLKRHVRRDLSLVREVKDAKSEKKIIEAMKHDGLTEEVQKKFSLDGNAEKLRSVCILKKR